MNRMYSSAIYIGTNDLASQLILEDCGLDFSTSESKSPKNKGEELIEDISYTAEDIIHVLVKVDEGILEIKDNGDAWIRLTLKKNKDNGLRIRKDSVFRITKGSQKKVRT